MKKIIRISLFVLGGIAALVAGFVLFIQLRGIPKYDVTDPGITITGDSTMVAHGARIANNLCVECHLNRSTMQLTGAYLPDVAAFGVIRAANITHDKEYGIGSWTDGQLLNLLRTGVKKDGQYAPPYMPKFLHMSDYDLHSIIAWLKSDDPRLLVEGVPDTACEPNFLAKFLCFVAFKPLPFPEKPILTPDTSDKVSFGKYLVQGRYECWACHSKSFETMNILEPEKTPGFLAGGNPIPDKEGKIVYSANLTPDAKTGIGNYSEEGFINCIKYGKRQDNTSNRYPMLPYTHMSDYEASSIFAYLKSLPAVTNKITR